MDVCFVSQRSHEPLLAMLCRMTTLCRTAVQNFATAMLCRTAGTPVSSPPSLQFLVACHLQNHQQCCEARSSTLLLSCPPLEPTRVCCQACLSVLMKHLCLLLCPSSSAAASHMYILGGRWGLTRLKRGEEGEGGGGGDELESASERLTSGSWCANGAVNGGRGTVWNTKGCRALEGIQGANRELQVVDGHQPMLGLVPS